MSNTDRDIKPGEMECALLSLLSDEHPSIDKNTPIELRCRYCCSQAGVDEDVFSEYSKVLTFETTEIGNDPQPTPTAEPVVDDPTPTPKEAPKDEKKDKCWLCGFCPQPLGLCVFIWLAIIIVITVVIVIVVRKINKEENSKEKKEKKN